MTTSSIINNTIITNTITKISKNIEKVLKLKIISNYETMDNSKDQTSEIKIQKW